jgi:hypothetical protein
MIKPIKTVYKGYRFRSRLEARWGVFFETLGIPWEYEKEGFQINGKYYLPDFYLPDIDTWIEIKPGPPKDWPNHLVFNYVPDSDEEWNSFPLKNFVLILGEPYVDRDDMSPDGFLYCGFINGDNDYYFCECPVCGKIGIEWNGRAERICKEKCCRYGRLFNTHTFRLLQAYSSARQARFEHGENG